MTKKINIDSDKHISNPQKTSKMSGRKSILKPTLPTFKTKTQPNLVQRKQMDSLIRRNEQLEKQVLELQKIIRTSDIKQKKRNSYTTKNDKINDELLPAATMAESYNTRQNRFSLLEIQDERDDTTNKEHMETEQINIADKQIEAEIDNSSNLDEIDKQGENQFAEEVDDLITRITKKNNKNNNTLTSLPSYKNLTHISTIDEPMTKINGDGEECTGTEKKVKCPPINIYNMDSKDVHDLLHKTIGTSKFYIKVVNKNRHSVKLNNIEDYRKAKEILDKTNTKFFSYTPKSDKKQTYLLKGIDISYGWFLGRNYFGAHLSFSIKKSMCKILHQKIISLTVYVQMLYLKIIKIRKFLNFTYVIIIMLQNND